MWHEIIAIETTNGNQIQIILLKCSAKGRTNIELREQFILADGVSQSMAVFTPRRSIPNATQNGNNLPPYMSSQGPITKVNSYKFISSTKQIFILYKKKKII